MSETPLRHGNIRHLEWLPIIDRAGRRIIGLEEAFLTAHLIQKIDVRAPIERAAVLKFLTSVTALIAREQKSTLRDPESIATAGFNPAAVVAALDRIDDRLWLIHETTPFMQEGRFAPATSKTKKASSIRPTTPGDSTKAWWGRAGDGFSSGSLTMAEAPAALASFWFYSINNNTAVELSGVPLPIQGSASGKTVASGVRLWKTGESLAATFLMNTPLDWVSGTALPAWAQDLTVSGQLDPIIAGTITGNAVLLLAGTDGEDIVFTDAHIGSVLRTGIPPTAADHAARKAAEADFKSATALNKVLKAAGEPLVEKTPVPAAAVDTLKASLELAWLDDPQVVRRNQDPKEKSAQKPEDIRALKNVTASTSVLHNLQEWYVRSFNPEMPGALRRHILSREEFNSELFSIQYNQKGSYGELAAVSWLSMQPGTIGGSPATKDALTRFAEEAHGAVRTALWSSINAVLDDEKLSAAAVESAMQRYGTIAEDTINDVIDLALAGEQYGPEHVRAWSNAAVTAFDEVLAPYVSARRLPDIAQSRQRLISSIYGNKRKKATA